MTGYLLNTYSFGHGRPKPVMVLHRGDADTAGKTECGYDATADKWRWFGSVARCDEWVATQALDWQWCKLCSSDSSTRS